MPISASLGFKIEKLLTTEPNTHNIIMTICRPLIYFYYPQIEVQICISQSDTQTKV